MNIINESMFKKEKIGIGKRKEAVARVYIVPGNGSLVIIMFLEKNIYNIIQLI